MHKLWFVAASIYWGQVDNILYFQFPSLNRLCQKRFRGFEVPRDLNPRDLSITQTGDSRNITLCDLQGWNVVCISLCSLFSFFRRFGLVTEYDLQGELFAGGSA